MNTHARRMDVIIARLVRVRSSLQQNLDIEFDIEHVLATVEVAANALEVEVQDELEDAT